MRLLVLLLTVAGLVAAVAIVGSVGVAPVFAAVAAIGPGGYLVFCLYWLAVLAVLGVAWRAAAPGTAASLADFTWARTVREAATDVLPFAQIGGIVVGGRALTARGVAPPLAYASMIADITTELGAQLVFTLFGVGMLALLLGGAADDGGVLALALAGLGLTLALVAVFARAQRPVLRFAARVAAKLLPASVASLTSVESALATIYRERRGVAVSFAAHIAGWVGSAASAWLALRLMGVEIGLPAVLAIEALIFTVRSVVFVVPGGLGVQEGAYVLLAPLFGLDPQTAVALSLLKRARDLSFGVPVILWWQALEGRRLLRRRA